MLGADRAYNQVYDCNQQISVLCRWIDKISDYGQQEHEQLTSVMDALLDQAHSVIPSPMNDFLEVIRGATDILTRTFCRAIRWSSLTAQVRMVCLVFFGMGPSSYSRTALYRQYCLGKLWLTFPSLFSLLFESVSRHLTEVLDYAVYLLADPYLAAVTLICRPRWWWAMKFDGPPVVFQFFKSFSSWVINDPTLGVSAYRLVLQGICRPSKRSWLNKPIDAILLLI